MSAGSLTKPRNVGIGAMAAPLLIVGAMVLFNSAAEPRSSAAGVQAPPDPETIIRAAMSPLTEAQQAVVDFRASIPALGESDSPFPPVDEIAEDILDIFDPDADVEQIVGIPDFNVSAIMASKAGNIALINGKAHRIGDELEGGWIIKKIDAKTKQVDLTDADGESMTLRLNRPGAMPRH